MLDKQELRKQILQYFRAVGSGENIVQCIKEALFLHEKFSPLLTFEILSRGKQKMGISDIRIFLQTHNLTFSEDELKYVAKLNNFTSQTIFNEFLQAMIPFNADVVRQFKGKYVQSLQVKEFDPQVQFILTELFQNQIKLSRSLISIREDITKIASRSQIQALVKEDLVLHSKPREARKFHEAFQQRQFQLGYQQLRKFLEIWLPSKEVSHQFCLLNIMRHLKNANPFQKIIFKNKKTRVKSAAIPRQYKNITNNVTARQRLQKEQQSYRPERQSPNKYSDYKNKVLDQFQKQRQGHTERMRQSPQKSKRKTARQSQPLNQTLRRSKYERQSRGIDASLILQILQQIVIKEERLEKLRRNLAKCQQFNLTNLFKLLDSKGKGFLTSKDFSDYTTVGKVQYNHMVKFYAREQEKLRFHQFSLIFRPLSKQLNTTMDKRPQNKVLNPFKKETTKLIIEIITLTADMHSNIFNSRQKIGSSGIDHKQYFNFLDLQSKGYISARCFQDVLSENHIFCEQKDLKCLMKLFRKKIDERITFKQFSSFIDL